MNSDFMKKILFMIPDLAGGGAEKVLVNLVNNMDRAKFDITVKTLFDVGVNRDKLLPHIKREYCFKKQFRGNSKFFLLFKPEFLFKKFVKGHYDIIVSYLEGPTARIVSGCTDKETKLVSWIHVEQHTKERLSASFRSFSEALKCYNKFDKTICVSQFVKEDFAGILNYKKDIEVLYNTNETKQILELSNEAVNDYEFGTLRTIIGIGTLKKSKGFDRLARIHKRLLDDGIRHNVIILGTGPEEQSLKSLLEELNISDTVSLPGYNSNPYKYIKNSDLFVCTSISEGFSTAATEALIVGTPVCTVEVSGMKEMLGENNEYGIVTDNNEDALYSGIKRMLTEDGLLDYYAKQAKIRGKHFSTEKTVRAVEEMFDKL